MDRIQTRVANLEETMMERNSMGLPLPSCYNGSDDFLTYLKEFNRVATGHGWQPPRCCQILPIYLRGAALAIYEGMPEEEKNNWKNLVEGLANRLKKISTREVARLKMIERRQKVGETVDEFAQSLRTLVERAYPDSSLDVDLAALTLDPAVTNNVKGELGKMTKRFRDEQCRDRFRAGLLPEIKEKIIFMDDPRSLNEAVTQAKRVEELNSSIKEDVWRRTKEVEVKATLAEVNEIRANRDREMNGMKNEPNWQTQNYRQNNYSRGNQWGQRGNRGEWRRGPANQFQSWNQGYRGNQNARNFRNQRGQRWTPGPSRNPNSIPVPSGGTSGARGRGTNFQRGTYRINETSFPYICFLAMICLILPLTNGQFQICPNFPEGTGIVMNFPKDHNCTIKLEEIPELVKIHIFVPIRLPKKFPVVRCQKWIVRMCTESYLGIYSKEKDANIVFTKISKEECWHTWDTQLLQRRGENVWQTPSNWDKEYSFFGVKCKNVTGTTLEEGSGAILDGRKLVTSWGDEFLISKKQDENEGWTKTQEIEEILMWRIPDQTYWNTHFRVGPVSAEIWSPRAIVVDELQYSFIYHKNATHPENMHGLPELAIRMENDVFVEIIEEKLENKTRVKKQSGTGFLKKNRKLFEGRTTTQGTTLRVQGVETTIPATVTQKPITRREETRTPIWKVTPSTRNLMPVTERPSVISVPTTPKGITATRKLSLTTPSTTRPLTTTLRARTTSRTPIIPNTSRRLVFTTAGTPRKFITTTTPRRITSTPSTTTRRVTYSLRPATKIRTSTQSASTTRKTEITTKTPAIIEKPLSRLKPEGQGDEIKKIQIPQKLIATTEKSTTTVVIKRDVSEKPWFDPGDESHSNSRLNYLDWKTEQRRVVEAREKWINDCHNRNTQLAIARTLAREMPEQAARSLYNRDDITAYLLNSQDGQLKWQINRCQQVKAESIEWNQMIGQDCYKEIPVTVKNRKYFLKPGGRDLKEEGIKINCSQKKKISDQKSKNTTKMEELNLRESFKSSPHINRQNPLIFNLGSIFESEQNRLDQNLQDLTKRVNRPELTFPEDEVSEDEIPEEKNITRGTVRAVLAHGNKAIQTVIEQGNVIITKSTEVIEKGTNFLQDPFGIMSTIKMIVIIMACVAILIGLCVIYWKGKIYFMIVINGARTGIRLANTILNLIKPRRQSRPLTVAAVEKRLTPTAPLAEEVLEEEAYILDFIPKVYQVGSKKRRCYVNISLNGNKTRALFDTRADITYVSQNTAKSCGMKINKGDFPQALAANSTPICLLGSSNTLIEIGNFRKNFPVLISENEGCPGGAIIGTDLMEEINREEEDYTIGIDFKNGEVQLGRIKLPMIHAINMEEKPLAVQLLKTHLLPPLSDSLVWGRVNKGVGSEEQFITVERQHQYFPLRVGKCLVKPMAKRIVPLRLMNYGNSEIKIHANSKLADLEPIGGGPEIKTITERDELCMTDKEWKEFKEEVDQIPEEANWIKNLPDEPLNKQEKPVFEKNLP
uniref:Uncharacterized protein n=3 Tax=Meloidogyne TaxID=189290 RepID=A0A6V7Y9N7_MELEN|nr:unnamed protein product [Meloidogyne enterolobii]